MIKNYMMEFGLNYADSLNHHDDWLRRNGHLSSESSSSVLK